VTVRRLILTSRTFAHADAGHGRLMRCGSSWLSRPTRSSSRVPRGCTPAGPGRVRSWWTR